MAGNRHNIMDPATASDAGYSAPLDPATANLRTQLTRGQEQLIAWTTDAGDDVMSFAGVAVGEFPTGGAGGVLAYRNGDVYPVRIRRLYMSLGPAGLVQGQILFKLRIGSSDLATGMIHSGTIGANVLPFDLGEGFIVLPGQKVTMSDVRAQIPVPAAFDVRLTASAIREVNYDRQAVPSNPEAEGALLHKLRTAIESADSIEATATLARADLSRRWWAFQNGEGITADGVGGDPSVYGFGGVDLTGGAPVSTGFQNEQTGPFLLEALYFFSDPDAVGGGGFQINSIEIGNNQYIAPGGPIRSDVLRVGVFPGGVGVSPFGQLAIPYIFGVPVWCTSNRSIRVVLQEALGLTPGNVWISYVGTLFGNPQR